MASIVKRGDSYRVVVSHKGHRLTATFPTKSECKAWASIQEQEIRNRKIGKLPDKTLDDILDRYAKEISPKKKGELWEIKRIRVLKGYRIASVRLSDLNPTHVSEWRDQRLKDVSGSSVCRDWNLLSHACETAKREWGWLHENPFKNQVSRPKSSPPREKVFSDDEIKTIVFVLGQDYKTVSGRVAAAFLFAIETGMRAGEIVGLTPADVFGSYVRIRDSKNGSPRDVPLSSKASEIINKCRDNGTYTVFGINSRQLDVLFRKARDKAGVEGKFHDARRTALTRLAKIFSIMELAKISGHKDLRILLNTYYAPSAEELASKMV